MQHFLLLSLALSTLAVLAAAGKKLEELSPAARDFLKKRQKLIADQEVEKQAFIRNTPGSKEWDDFNKKMDIWRGQNKHLSSGKRGTAPRMPAIAANYRQALSDFCGKQQKRLSDFNGSNPNAFNELFVNGYCPDVFG